ncbi:hypothetical protein NKH77_49685 [Streptomyces sp. M19]
MADWNEELAAAFGLRVGWRLHGHGRGAANAAVLAYQAPGFARWRRRCRTAW